jgi:hypothetical protein
MSEVPSRRSPGLKFSLIHLLILTALIAIGIAVGLAYRKNQTLTTQRDTLLALSSRLQIDNEDELAMAAMPAVANDFNSWQVHVPAGRVYELRLGMGEVSQNGIPPLVASVPISAGQHRVTLFTGDSPSEEFRYLIYVDGEQVMEHAMGSDWMPNGWSSASGIDWPREAKGAQTPMQLAGQSYDPKITSETGDYFNGQSDRYVTRSGYRLWIDQHDSTYQPASPFMGFTEDPQYQGVGLRDGLRYTQSFGLRHQWTIARPKLATVEPMLRMEVEFFLSDGSVLSGQKFQSWQLRNAASGKDPLQWQQEPAQTTYTAFLHADSTSDDALQPVVELKWDTNRPDEVALRLADTPANDRISRWRLRILDGRQHLWRKLQLGAGSWITPDDAIKTGEVVHESSEKTPSTKVTLDLGEESTTDVQLQWQTNETLPLQIVQRKDKRYAGLKFYSGLPVTTGIQIPAALKPTLAVEVVNQHPITPETAFPGGPVFDQIELELESNAPEWIWLKAKSSEK